LLAGGIGFLLGDFVQIVQRAHWGPFQYAVLQEHGGWGKMEKLFGLIMGWGVALGVARLARDGLEAPVEDESGGYLNEFAVFFFFVPMMAWNFGQNLTRWAADDAFPAQVLGLSGFFWASFCGLLLTALVLVALKRQRARGLAFVPSSALGKGQLLFLALQGLIVGASFAGSLPQLASPSVATSEVFYIVCASAASFAILFHGPPRQTPVHASRTRADAAWQAGWSYWAGWFMVPALVVGLAGISVAIAPPTTNPNFYRFSRPPEPSTQAGSPRATIPDRLVVLTFDDSVKSHVTVAAPILKKYGFSATFFITEGFTFHSNKNDYMTWEEIKELDRQGFEIGNHTRDHVGIQADNVDRLEEQLYGIDEGCARMGIPRPSSFAWPGNQFAVEALPVLRKHGIAFARRGGKPEFAYEEGRGTAYEPGADDPLLIPTTGDARPGWTLDDLIRAVTQAHDGRIAVLQFHGVPEGEHPWVHTPRERFEEYMEYLAAHGYRVIAVRDLARYVDPQVRPADPQAVIERRMVAKRQ
jgi:peptidoglycan/xylan/chitin deacetylase (PgdA/CDA1 family)